MRDAPNVTVDSGRLEPDQEQYLQEQYLYEYYGPGYISGGDTTPAPEDS